MRHGRESADFSDFLDKTTQTVTPKYPIIVPRYALLVTRVPQLYKKRSETEEVKPKETKQQKLLPAAADPPPPARRSGAVFVTCSLVLCVFLYNWGIWIPNKSTKERLLGTLE